MFCMSMCVWCMPICTHSCIHIGECSHVCGCSCMYQCICRYMCTHVKFQSWHWMFSSVSLPFIYWGKVSCWAQSASVSASLPGGLFGILCLCLQNVTMTGGHHTCSAGPPYLHKCSFRSISSLSSHGSLSSLVLQHCPASRPQDSSCLC